MTENVPAPPSSRHMLAVLPEGTAGKHASGIDSPPDKR
jgi:hypothetical protein